MTWMLLILSRYTHVLCACLIVGGAFVLSVAVRDASAAENPAFLRARRALKMTIHIGLLLMLASGIYNTLNNWEAYSHNKPITHALLGMHFLLALGGLIVLLVAFGAKTPSPREGKTIGWVIWVLFAAVLMASLLKYAREHPKAVVSSVQTSLSKQSE